jgi:hypothetical protein
VTGVSLAVDAVFARLGQDAVFTPQGGAELPIRVIGKRPDAIVEFGDTRIHAETTIFEVRVSELADPLPGDEVAVGGAAYVVQGEPERRDPDRLVWTLDVRPA